MERRDENSFKNKLSKRIICTPSPAAKNSFFYVQETGCLKTEDAAATQRHNLESFLIAAIISGRGELTIGNETFALMKGDCFFVDCRVSHFYKSSEADPWEIMWIHFNGATSQQYYDFFISQSKNVFRPPFFDKVVSDIIFVTIFEIIQVIIDGLYICFGISTIYDSCRCL